MKSTPEKAVALFQYLKELSALKQTIIKNINRQIWDCSFRDIPVEPENIKLYNRNLTYTELLPNAVLLEVHKPDFSPCPEPPKLIEEWLCEGWNSFRQEVKYKETLSYENNQVKEKFSDSNERVQLSEQWNIVRQKWVEQQRLADRIRKFFVKLYEIHSLLEKEADTMELVVANGFIREADGKDVNHPILIKKVSIVFEAKENIIRILETDAESEIYTMLFQEMQGINHAAIKILKEDLHDNFYHPLDQEDTQEFLKTFIHLLCVDSKFLLENEENDYAEENLCMIFKPTFFVRKKLDGSVKAFEEIIEDIEDKGKVNGPIGDVIGAGKIDIPDVPTEKTIDEQLAACSGESLEILLAKEANREQLEIARRIKYYNAVLVQGPPGTGKTHTIANLLGHFLAQGNSVLVTSYTKKALSVLKEKVPKGVSNLCVSLLDDTNNDMERSVDGISEYLSKHSSLEIKEKMESTQRQRTEIIEQLNETRRKIYTIKLQEFKPIVYNGRSYSPLEAAKFVRDNTEELSYIPGKVKLYHPLPLTRAELIDLYSSNESISCTEEEELQLELPNPNELIIPEIYENILILINNANEEKVAIEKELKVQVKFDFSNRKIMLKKGNDFKEAIIQPTDDSLELLLKTTVKAKSVEKWMVQAAVDGKRGGGHKERWEQLIFSIEDTAETNQSLIADVIGKRINIKDDVDSAEFKLALSAAENILRKKNKISKWDLLFNKKLKSVLEMVSINDKPIAKAEDCELINKCLTVKEKRKNLENYWDELIAKYGKPTFKQLSAEEPERVCLNLVTTIKQYLNWYENEYMPTQKLLDGAGFNKECLFDINDLDSEETVIHKSLIAIYERVPVFGELIKAFLSIEEARKTIMVNKSYLKKESLANSETCHNLIVAMKNKDSRAYKVYFDALVKIYAKNSTKLLRNQLLKKLETFSPEWASAIKRRNGIFGSVIPPNTIEDAWKWKQFAGIIDEITAEPFEELQHKNVELSKTLREKTAELVEYRAWYNLLQKTEKNLDLRQALQGWKKTIKKIGKGTGKNAPRNKRIARGLMVKCQDAVPAWIMPINRALENLNPKENVFDVLIVDEASQADISALALAYMAKKVIIVGDDKQVSPMAVGLDIDRMNNLMEMYIKDIIPNWHLYDAKSSLYDIAGTTYAPLMLLEHFRCVPDIIGYSNRYSYNLRIKPLRDMSDCEIFPSVVSYRVLDGNRDGRRKVNIKEAENIVALIAACIEQHEYNGKTFGVISLLGEEQAQKIQEIAFNRIDLSIIEERRIICGDAAHFQGDERDIVFISLVDSNVDEGPLSLASEGPGDSRKQRYNVAASRAKDQMWIVHSLDNSHDLKNGDMRKALIEYAENPKAFAIVEETIEIKSESPFEKAVAKYLVVAGYHLVQQWQVGAYRIDMVVISGTSKIAIECDGEQYHSGEERVRYDMERQTILERLGWSFIRIRGSEYYLNPEKAMKRVIAELDEHGIYPESNELCENAYDDSELLSRVKIRAAQILDEWQQSSNDNLLFGDIQ